MFRPHDEAPSPAVSLTISTCPVEIYRDFAARTGVPEISTAKVPTHFHLATDRRGALACALSTWSGVKPFALVHRGQDILFADNVAHVRQGDIWRSVLTAPAPIFTAYLLEGDLVLVHEIGVLRVDGLWQSRWSVQTDILSSYTLSPDRQEIHVQEWDRGRRVRIAVADGSILAASAPMDVEHA